MDNSRLDQSMLLDFYGELLTARQRDCFDLHYNEDLSLSEIAEQLGISRQGVWDSIRHAQSAMEDVESKTGLIGRFQETRRGLESLKEKMERLRSVTDGEAASLAGEAAAVIDALLSRG